MEKPKIVDSLLLTITLSLFLTSAVASSAPGPYSWRPYPQGVACLQNIGGGRFSSVDPSLCMQYVGAKVNWATLADGTLGCAELTPDGIFLQTIQNRFCTQRLPTHFAMTQLADGTLECDRLTANNTFIEAVSGSHCSTPIGGGVTPEQPPVVVTPTPRPHPRPTRPTPTPDPIQPAQPTPKPTPSAKPTSATSPAPIATPDPEPPAQVSTPTPIAQPAPTPARAADSPGYHWSDDSHSSCILYGQDGMVEHLAAPASCK